MISPVLPTWRISMEMFTRSASTSCVSRGAGLLFMRLLQAMTKALEKTAARMDLLEQMTGRHIHFTQEDRAARLEKTKDYDFPQCYAMHGEAAFVDVHGNIYACSSLMGRERYLLGNVHEGRDPE